MPMTGTKRRILLIAGSVVVLIVISGLVPISLSDAFVMKYGDAMDWRGAWLAGRRGVNCGRVRIGQAPGATTNCGLEAHAAGRPFRVRYDIMGYDEPVAGGLVGAADGRLYALSFMGDPSGGGRTSLWGQRANVQLCPQPFRLYVNPTGRLNCFQAALSPPAGITSPNMEPY
jgi:hypothetical protein